MPVTIETASEEHLEGTKGWLKAEEESTGAGFFCNWSMIERAFIEGRALCAVEGGTSVGFVVLSIHPPSAVVEIVETRPGYRKRGIASLLIEASQRRLRGEGVESVWTICTSAEGEALFGGHGFRSPPKPFDIRMLAKDL